MDVKIPFAVHKETSELMEVGDVPRGRLCECLCPSCSQSVIARHGKVNVWHFAHDSDAKSKPLKECDISFDSCCRQFAMDMMIAGDTATLQTPDWVLNGRGLGGRAISVCVTRGRVIEGVEFRKDKRFDLASTVAGKTLFIHFEYPERHMPDLAGVSSGVLEIDLGVIKRQYYSQKSEPGLIRRLISELTQESTESKEWLQHPSLERARTELRRRVAEDKAPYIPPQPLVEDEWDEMLNVPRSLPMVEKSRPELTGTFSCVMCSSSWNGKRETDRDCPTCKTHLYATFTLD